MKIQLDREELKSIISEVLAEAADRFGDDDQLAFNEEHAAAMVDVAKHVLRDERLRGRIKPGKSGRNWLYSRRMLLQYIEQNMTEE